MVLLRTGNGIISRGWLNGRLTGELRLRSFFSAKGATPYQRAHLITVLNRGLESPRNPQAGKPALRTASRPDSQPP